jgi:hypothetical protein
MNEVAIISEMRFDKQDIVIVAMAKIEANIRGKVKSFKAKANFLNSEIEQATKEIPKFGEAAPPLGFVVKMNSLNKALKTAKLGKEVQWNIAYTCVTGLEENRYHLMLSHLDSKGGFVPNSGAVAATHVTPFSRVQSDYLKKIEKYTQDETDAIDQGIEWKSKLKDMPAAERQMRAVVVEAELKKTKTGKALVKLLTDNYEETIKKISMS